MATTFSAACVRADWKTLATPRCMERCAAFTRRACSSRMWFPPTRDRTASPTGSTIEAAVHSTNLPRRGARSPEPSINCSTGGAPPMPDSKQANDVASYATEVRAALAHLPDAEREILLEDLESHLEEVASESGLPLRERLGKAADYD